MRNPGWFSVRLVQGRGNILIGLSMITINCKKYFQSTIENVREIR